MCTRGAGKWFDPTLQKVRPPSLGSSTTAGAGEGSARSVARDLSLKPGTHETSITCPILIGRDQFVSHFERAFTAVIAGEGLTLTIAGEAGVGKSRLVSALAARAVQLAPAVRVAQGRCFERDGSLPFAPVVDLWRSFAIKAESEELRATLQAEAPDLVRLLPELSSSFPDAATLPAAEPEQEKRRLFHALLQPILRLADERPLLVIIEDLHWCDETSLEFLGQLSRRARECHLGLLLTYRADEVGPSLAHFLAGLDRERLADEVALERLSRADVAGMIAAVFDLKAPPRAEVVAPLYDLTDGNPFFVEEVLKSLTSAAEMFSGNVSSDRTRWTELNVPRSVQDTVRQRSAQLSPEARRLLVLAAVAGRRFDLTLLSELSQTTEASMLKLIKELVGAQFVVEESADHFAFRHALTQQAIYSGLLIRERRALHLEIARAMEAGGATATESHLGDLAHHYYEAAVWDRAFEYSWRVGQLAQDLFSPAAAVRHFTRALDAAKHSGQAPPVWIHSARGRAHDALGEFDRAREDHEAALRLGRAAFDRAGEWQALIDLGFLWATRDYERAGDFFRLALDAASRNADGAMLARSRNRLGNWLVNVGRAVEGLEEHRAALEIFTAAGDRQGIAETLDLLGMAKGICGDLPRCVDHYGRAIELLSELGDEQRLMSALSSRTIYGSAAMSETVPGAITTIDEARKGGERALWLAERSGSSVGSAYAHWTLGAALSASGCFGEGLQLAEEGLRIATEIHHEQWMVGSYFTLGQALWLLLDPDAAIAQLEPGLPLARSLKSVWWIGNVSCYLALAHLMSNNIASARAVLEETSFSDDGFRTLPERRIAWARAELLLAEDSPQASLSLTERLLATGAGSPSTHLPPPLLVTNARALSALGRSVEACEALERAESSAAGSGDLPWLWRAQYALSRAYSVVARRHDAGAKQAEASIHLARLAGSIGEDRRDRFLTASQAYARLRPLTQRRAAKEEWGGLTEREREIAGLVTRGGTNRDIAGTLVLSERTVETHISNILAKLAFTSRSQIAAWGADRGLLAD